MYCTVSIEAMQGKIRVDQEEGSANYYLCSMVLLILLQYCMSVQQMQPIKYMHQLKLHFS